MNFLAHMLLSCDSDTLVTGNFLGDLLRRGEVEALPEPIRAGIRLHRQIDFFTDNHPRVRKSTRLLHDRHRKYAPVLVDVYYDFFLSRHWKRFSDESLEDFTQKVYRQLLSHLEVMPERVQRYLKAMVADNWLMNYGSYSGMEYTFSKMAHRVSRPDQFEGVVDSLKMFESKLETNFLAFFPDIQNYVGEICEGGPISAT